MRNQRKIWGEAVSSRTLGSPRLSLSAKRAFATLTVAAVAAVCAPPAQAASFPCVEAKSAVEKSICASPEISNLDEYLGRYYAAVRIGLVHAESCVVDDQRAWLRNVRDACKDASCLKRVYLERLATLHALQPGATSLRNVELPRLPPLVWIVPPAADQVAAPRNRPVKTLVASGRILDEIANGDGFVLQSNAGVKHLFAPLMFLGQPTIAVLAQLARDANARYEIRGKAELAQRGANAFSSGHCAFVYRTAP